MQHMGLAQDGFQQLASPAVAPATLPTAKASSKLLIPAYKYSSVGAHLDCQMI